MKFFQLGLIGMTGFGKTTKMIDIVNNLNHYRIIAIDDLEQLIDYSKSNQLKGFFNAYNLDELILMLANKQKFKIRCQFEILNDYEKIFDIVWKLNNIVLVIDEITLFSDSYNIPLNLNNIVKRGRPNNISLIYNSQRPADINRNVTSQSEFIISFRINEPRDISYFPKSFRTDREKIILLETLQVGQYIFIKGNSDDLYNKINVRL